MVGYRRAATFVDKFPQGAKPGDLPIELPTKVERVVNQKIAMAMGVKFSQSFLVRADRVIEWRLMADLRTLLIGGKGPEAYRQSRQERAEMIEEADVQL